ncbi:PQN-40 protein, partial [Aphelenchoides avenae]
MSRSSHVFSIFFVTVSLRTANAQFGEIAQVITGILGSGGGAGIGSALGGGGAAGLSGLSGLAGAGSAIGQGAAAGLGNIGSLYQLAQAALQLTGTGVGIANQASESAWFPVAVENVARMQREFQDRLLRPPSTIGPLAPPGTGGSGGGGAGGGGIFPALPGPPTSGAGTMGGLHGMIGTGTAVEVPIEYGKNFETENGSGETSSIAVRVTPNPESTQGPLTLLPQRPLPGLRSLLPGEASSGEETTDTLVPLPSPAPLIAPSSTPKVTIELPTEEGKTDYEDLINSRRIRPSGTSKELKPEKPEVEFSTDSEELLIPVSAPKAVAPQQFATKTQTSNAPGAANGTATTVSVSPQMVPALAKLITALRASNLTEEEFLEIAKQVLRKDK